MIEVTHLNLARGFRGGERQTLALIDALAGQVDQHAIVRRNGPLAHELQTLPDVRLSLVSGSPLSAFLASADARLLHSHEGRSVQVGAARSLISGSPFVVTRRIPQWPSANALTRWCYRRAGQLVTVSDAIGRQLRDYDDDLHPVTIHDCVFTMAADPATATRLRVGDEGRLIIGQVGEFDDSHKGQQLTLAVAEQFRDVYPHASFWLIGRGKDEIALREHAASIPRLSIIGWVENLADYYSAMDILVYPSRYEGLGSAMLEAMAFGLPVVAANVDGIPEIVRHGENGLLFEVGNERDFAAQLARLVDDPGLRTRLGSGARATASQFSAVSMAEKYLTLYRDLLNPNGRA